MRTAGVGFISGETASIFSWTTVSVGTETGSGSAWMMSGATVAGVAFVGFFDLVLFAGGFFAAGFLVAMKYWLPS